MKVSSLFNPDKIKEERKKFKEYQELMGSLTIENIPEEIMEEATKLIINQMMLHDYGVKIRFRRYGLEYTNGAIQRMQE